MAALFWGCTTLVLAFAIHLLLWRWRLPRYQTKSLLAIFFGTLAVVGIFQATGGVARLPRLNGVADFAELVLFVTACALAYTITYSALEADSPTLVLVRAIASAGPGGLSEADLQARVSDAVLIEPRVRDLVRDGMLAEREGRFQLTPKGRRFAGIFIGYRAILGAGKGG